MNTTTWEDWYGCVEAALVALQKQMEGRPVFVMGLSMGGTLATRLAQRHPGEVAGLVLVNPSYMTLRKDAFLAPFLARFIGKIGSGVGSDIKKPGITENAYAGTPLPAFVQLRKGWRETIPGIPDLRLPVLVLHSTEDHVVEPANTEYLLKHLTAEDVTSIELPESYHVATLDNDAETIFRESVAFMRRLGDESVA
jgi:carboxylesterase